MALSHPLTARSAFAASVLSLIDAVASGLLVFRSGTTDLCSITLADPSFTQVQPVLNSNAAPAAGTVTVTGVTDNFEFRDSAGNWVFGGTVTGTGGDGDIEITNTNLVVNDTITLTGFTYIACP